MRELIAGSGADLVLNGIVGAAGLASTVVALTEGIDVALANKESLVIGGVVCLIIYLNDGTNPSGYAPAVIGVAAAGLLTHLISELRDRLRIRQQRQAAHGGNGRDQREKRGIFLR